VNQRQVDQPGFEPLGHRSGGNHFDPQVHVGPGFGEAARQVDHPVRQRHRFVDRQHRQAG